MLKNFFACKIVVAANQRYPGNIQRSFRLKICLSRKTSKSWKISETFSPPKSSSPQIIDILEIFKDFFGCENVLAANHQYPENIQRLFRLQNCRSRKSEISWKHSKTFSPAKLSQPQIIDILELFKDFFACKIVLAATHHNSEKDEKLFLPAKLSQPQISDILETFKDFSACKIVLAATHQYSEKIQKLFCLQKCLSRKPSVSWKYSKTFSAAKMSQQQPIKILKIFKDSFACKIVLAANHLNPGKIQRLFRMQSCLRRKSSKSWKNSKIFSPAKLSSPQIVDILEIFKDFFGFKIILLATHQNSENNPKLFCLKNCLSRKSAISWKHSNIFPPAKLSQQQPINILKRFKDFFACKNVLAANHLYPGNIQRLFRLQKCLSSNPSKFSKYSKTLSPAKLSQPQII